MNEPHPQTATMLEDRFVALGTVRPGRVTWPAGKEFPWSDEECAAFVRGHMVRWPLPVDDLLDCLPGKVELVDGFAVQAS